MNGLPLTVSCTVVSVCDVCLLISMPIATTSLCITFSAVDFFNQINMLYGTITEFCTEESCPIMSAGPKYEYHWADGHTVKKPIKCSAPKYIDYLMTWVQDQLDDETLFPSKIGNYTFALSGNFCLNQNLATQCLQAAETTESRLLVARGVTRKIVGREV